VATGEVRATVSRRWGRLGGGQVSNYQAECHEDRVVSHDDVQKEKEPGVVAAVEA
jgi:hypothetical protein